MEKRDMRLCLRLMDLPTVRYESKNILWMTELPQRSNATPIIVGERLFVMAEPDELLCLDKKTGHLWLGQNGQDLWEQAYLVKKGDNAGWSVTEGSHPFFLTRTPISS